MNSSEAALNASEVVVMDELATIDHMQAEEDAHQRRLNTIGFLQVPSPLEEEKLGTTSGMVEELLSSFAYTKVAHEESEARLKEAFQKLFQAGVDRQTRLNGETAQLN